MTTPDAPTGPLLDGYRELNRRELALVDRVKAVEREVAELWHDVRDSHGTMNGAGDWTYVDARWSAVARTHLQEGFTALVRSVTRPADPFADPDPRSRDSHSREDR